MSLESAPLDRSCEQTALTAALQREIVGRQRVEAEVERLNAELRTRLDQLKDSNGELEAFSYSISHDLRAPLRHIQSYAEMLTEATAGRLADQETHYLQTISQVSVEMGEMIDHLLAFSRMSRAKPRTATVSMDTLVAEVIQGFGAEVNGRNIVWKVAALPAVDADVSLLRLVLVNLLGNALKYTRRRECTEIGIGAGLLDGQPVFHVRDNGAGFDPQYAGKLFGVFQRLHRADEFEGSGIGLATVRRIISRHGGKVWAEGRPDQGATFFFTLPPAVTP